MRIPRASSILQPVYGSDQVEVIRFKKSGEYFNVQLAINGVLAPGQDVHASTMEEFRDEQSLMRYLINSAKTLIDVFGDARSMRPAEAA